MRLAAELLDECEQHTAADSTATDDDNDNNDERHHYDTLVHRYRDIVANISSLVTSTTESIEKQHNLDVSLCLVEADNIPN